MADNGSILMAIDSQCRLLHLPARHDGQTKLGYKQITAGIERELRKIGKKEAGVDFVSKQAGLHVVKK